MTRPQRGGLQGSLRYRDLLRGTPVVRRASVADWARGGLRVELVRVVQNARFGSSRRGPVVVARDGVEELGEDGGIEVSRALLDHPKAEVDMSEQATLLRLAKRGAYAELPDTADVVEERRGEQEVVAEPRMELRGLATERRDADRVLEQPSRVAVVPVCARGWK